MLKKKRIGVGVRGSYNPLHRKKKMLSVKRGRRKTSFISMAGKVDFGKQIRRIGICTEYVN